MSAQFTISGSRTMGEVLMPALVEAFAARNGYSVARRVDDDTHFVYVLAEPATGQAAAQIRFRVTSTSEGFADLLANEADLVLSIRPASAMERALTQEAGLGDLGDPRRSRIVALDGIVPIVAPGNPLRSLSIEELGAAFAGETDYLGRFAASTTRQSRCTCATSCRGWRRNSCRAFWATARAFRRRSSATTATRIWLTPWRATPRPSASPRFPSLEMRWRFISAASAG